MRRRRRPRLVRLLALVAPGAFGALAATGCTGMITGGEHLDDAGAERLDARDEPTTPDARDEPTTPDARSVAPPDAPPAPERLTIAELVGGVPYSVVQDYGPTPPNGWDYSYCQAYGDWGGENVHCGIDIGIASGTPLFVPEAGRVQTAGESSYYEDLYHPEAGELRIVTAEGTHIILGHMSRIDVARDVAVSPGDGAGLSGTTSSNLAYGHLHLEVRVRDSSLASGMRTVDPAIYFGL